VAHVVTVKPTPGESPVSSAISILFALIFPTSGLLRGMRAIFSGAIFAKTDLEKAARAGALYTVHRGRGVSFEPLKPTDTFQIRGG
jgi:hypothetical protein